MKRQVSLIFGLILTQTGCNLSEIQSALNSATATAAVSSDTSTSDSSSLASSTQKPGELQDCSLKTQLTLTLSNADLASDFNEVKVKVEEKVLESSCDNIKVDTVKNVQVKKIEKKSDQLSIYRGPTAEVYTILSDRSLVGQSLEFCHHGAKAVISFDSGLINIDDKTISITRTITSTQDSSCDQKKELRQQPNPGDKRKLPDGQE